jgi:hypothetical protein
MHLNAQQFAEIVSSLDRSLIDHKSDQRRSSRAIQRRSIMILPVSNGQQGSSIAVAMVDFSTRGMGIIHNEPFGRGEQFITRLVRDGKPPVELLCTVAHCRGVSNNSYKIGAEFTCIVTPQPKAVAASGEVDRIRQKMFK